MPEAAESAFRLRAATTADAVALARLWTAAFTETTATPRETPYTADEALALTVDHEARLATGAGARDGELLGAVLLAEHGTPSANLTQGPQDAQLLLLAVRRGARGSGVGRALADWCLRAAAARGRRRVWLWSRPAQTAAHALYRSLGFVRAPERDFDAGGEPARVFVCALQPGDASHG